MRIVIDMQGAQTENRCREIGRYTMSLAKAIALNRGEHEVVIALNGLFTDTIEPIRAAFYGLLPQENIRVWYAPGPVCECETGNEWRRQTAEVLRESFIASLRPDIVYISSLFEGYTNDAVTSVGAFVSNLVTVVAVHDLPEKNEQAADSPSLLYNVRKIEYLKRANLCHIVSVNEAEKIVHNLNLDMGRVVICRTITESDSSQKLFNAEAKSLLENFTYLKGQLIAQSESRLKTLHVRRPKLAFVSPFPPERSGISDYSAELLPELARYYDIEVIVDQETISDPWIKKNCPVRSVEWFRAHTHHFDRVLYHFGNSPFHQHMFDLLELAPGVVALHDFFLSNLVAYRDFKGASPGCWAEALYCSHGYHAIKQRFQTSDLDEFVGTYPCNLSVLQNSQGIIVHSETSRRLAHKWYGERVGDDWAIIPLLRAPAKEPNRKAIRRKLKLNDDDFIVCSFGMLVSTKLNHRLLEAWIASNLATQSQCKLVFVGEKPVGEYGLQLMKTIRESGLGDRICITGWADATTFRDYLSAADVAVQLRTLSRGETSAAVLDCMNHAVPTIVNDHGSMTDLPTDAVWMLPDEFEDHQLVEALETLKQDSVRRTALGDRAHEIILTRHAPQICAEQYADAIELFHAQAQSGSHILIKAIAALDCHQPVDAEIKTLAQSIAQALPPKYRPRQLLIDVSAICRDDLKTGIQRVVRSLVSELLSSDKGYRVEPVFLNNDGEQWQYYYAREWTFNLLGVTDEGFFDQIVDFNADDILLVADFTGMYAIEGGRSGVFDFLRNIGVEINFVLYDLLPVKMPMMFPPEQFGFSEWLNLISRIADRVICISSAVADDMREWLNVLGPHRTRPLMVDWFHLGADMSNSVPTCGTPEGSSRVLSQLSTCPSFLMVGTIEPRKGYLQTLDAFSQLWTEGYEVNLVIVGNEGWKGLSDNKRRTIPETVKRLRNHPELDRHLFWLEGISDEYLEKVYAASTCLIAPSEGEGFGLPLIEAAQHKLPIIARDIPVFREVAGGHAYYFEGMKTTDLKAALQTWLELYHQTKHPKSDVLPWLSWKQSTHQLLNVLLNKQQIDLTSCLN